MIFCSMFDKIRSSNIGFITTTADVSAVVVAAVDMPL